MERQPSFAVFKPLDLQVAINRPRFGKGLPFEFGLGSILVQEMRSFVQGSKNPTTQTSTLKFAKQVVAKVMQANKVAKLFQTMAIVSLNMGSLNLEMGSLKNRLVIKETKKAVLQLELDKERDFQKEYKHNIKIWRKNKVENKHKIKTFIQKLKDKNKELKVRITRMKSQAEEL